MSTKVSVVITTHNRSSALLEAIKSVRNQSYKNIEIVVVDDASSDDTESVCKHSLTGSDYQYVFISSEESKGGNYARNKGILAAKGEYVALMDDDDTWDRYKVEKQVQFMLEHPDIYGVATTFNEIFVLGNTNYTSVIDKYYYAYIDNTFEKKGKKFPYAYLGITSALMLNREALIEIGMFDQDLIAFQEVEMTYRFRKKYAMGVINDPLVNYYNHVGTKKTQVSNSISRTETALQYIEKKYKDEFSLFNAEDNAVWNATKNSCLFDRCVRSGDKKNAWRYGLRTMKYTQGLISKLKFLFKFFIVYCFDFKVFIKIKALSYKFKHE